MNAQVKFSIRHSRMGRISRATAFLQAVRIGRTKPDSESLKRLISRQPGLVFEKGGHRVFRKTCISDSFWTKNHLGRVSPVTAKSNVGFGVCRRGANTEKHKFFVDSTSNWSLPMVCPLPTTIAGFQGTMLRLLLYVSSRKLRQKTYVYENEQRVAEEKSHSRAV
ncbi:uncharacterized protein SCHCODRAFT_02282105 [Schizophyllum commune H4-8]|uniref:uncharacterized protein n=1 Tax=Schizophyllum commune (strain H4-8 / FGSC 9210) TaxID=578458 RepID=UPI00215EDBDD|nr:uncharacterized protein SCHCODRAFT_02282105 [Schizophyllum commune H4-8]KAI5892073.1 hypothetical protein SCHCODRAFT_02282105 [Schizophyllum commune H4-8]